MEKIKNFVYDKSDLLVAVIIIALSALVIWFGINNIMEPLTETADAQGGQLQSEDAATTEPAVTSDAATTTGTAAATSPAATTKGSTATNAAVTKKAAKIKISAGDDTDVIASNLVAAKVIKDKNKFYTKLEKLGLSSRIQEGTFNIPAGSTLEDVCRIITETN